MEYLNVSSLVGALGVIDVSNMKLLNDSFKIYEESPVEVKYDLTGLF